MTDSPRTYTIDGVTVRALGHPEVLPHPARAWWIDVPDSVVDRFAARRAAHLIDPDPGPSFADTAHLIEIDPRP